MPEIGRQLGKAIRDFKKAMNDGVGNDGPRVTAAPKAQVPGRESLPPPAAPPIVMNPATPSDSVARGQTELPAVPVERPAETSVET